MPTPGLKTIIALSFVRSLLRTHSTHAARAMLEPQQSRSANRSPQPQVLAIGFLLVILSSALWKNYLPLLVVATYVLAPVPNWLCGRASNADDFMDSGSNGVVELGRFLTGFLVVMGVGTFMRLDMVLAW